MTSYELEFTKKVLGGVVAKEKEEGGVRTEAEEEERRAHQEILKQLRGEGGKSEEGMACNCRIM